jgi:threonine/homoserine/homoserine lactone efflux protein
MQLLPGLVMGLAYAAAPGPITVETLRRGIRGGLRQSLAVQAGSSIGIVVYALLALFGAGLLPLAGWQWAASLAGTAILLYLGLVTIRDGGRLAFAPCAELRGRTSVRSALGTGALLSLANPLDIVFWFGLGGRLLDDPALDAPAFLGGFLFGLVAASLSLAVIAAGWRHRLTPRSMRGLAWLCGLAFIAFGLQLGLTAARHLIAA